MTFLNKPDLINLPEMLKAKRDGLPPFLTFKQTINRSKLPYIPGVNLGMVRSKKHITKFSWSEAVEAAAAKYKGNWVNGPLGTFWVHSVYPEIGGVACMLFPNDQYNQPGRKVMVSELDEKYTLI